VNERYFIFERERTRKKDRETGRNIVRGKSSTLREREREREREVEIVNWCASVCVWCV
jgi:hypothetical protein